MRTLVSIVASSLPGLSLRVLDTKDYFLGPLTLSFIPLFKF